METGAAGALTVKIENPEPDGGGAAARCDREHFSHAGG